MRILSIFLLLGITTFALACQPPRPLTFEEQEAYMAKQQCIQEANSMNSEWPSSENPYWNAYFVMCMNKLGISDAAIRRMWY